MKLKVLRQLMGRQQVNTKYLLDIASTRSMSTLQNYLIELILLTCVRQVPRLWIS